MYTVYSAVLRWCACAVVNARIMQGHLTAVRHVRWFEENAFHSGIKVLVRLLRDLQNRFEGLSGLTTWMIDLLVTYWLYLITATMQTSLISSIFITEKNDFKNKTVHSNDIVLRILCALCRNEAQKLSSVYHVFQAVLTLKGRLVKFCKFTYSLIT